jgi:UDP-glucuronate decarboxylase
MKILIAGGAGFLGSHLSERLLREGHEVTVVDNLNTGKKDNIKHLFANAKFSYLSADILHLGVANFVHTFDRIYNLACPASPPHYQINPIYTMLTCVNGTNNLLKIAKWHGARFLQASTSEVYGDPEIHPQTEEYLGNVSCIGIRSCYDEGKRAAESLCFDYRRMYGLEIKVARIFNTYGPRMRPDDGRVVSNFICQALRGEAITIYGNGDQTRSFCYVDDMVSGLIALMESNLTLANVGNPDEYEIRDMAEIIVKMCDSKSEVVFMTLPQDDPTKRKPDISRMETIGWSPTTKLEQGLRQTINYFKGILK